MPLYDIKVTNFIKFLILFEVIYMTRFELFHVYFNNNQISLISYHLS